MSLFEYVMVLISVVLSLGLALLLTDLAKLIRAGRRVRWSFVFVLWMIEAVSIHLDMWTSLWSLHDLPAWSFVGLLLTLVSAGLIFMSVALMMPEPAEDGSIDLWAWHLSQRRRFIGAFVGYSLSVAVLNSFVLPAEFEWLNIAYILPNVTLLGLAIWFSNKWVQRIVPVIILAIDTQYYLTHYATIS